jgi:hypothetical protein
MKLRLLSLFVLLTLSCVPTLKREMNVDRYLPARRFARATQFLTQNEAQFDHENRLLFLLNQGAIHHYAQDYGKSNEYLLDAHTLSEALYTQNIAKEVAGVFTDNFTDYDGEDYEKVLINVFLLLNYIQLNQLDDALVEARRIDAKLQLLAQTYEAENKYNNDALARYLSGLIYEMDHDDGNAFIAYVKTYEAYKDYARMFGFACPDSIEDDILRLAFKLGYHEQYETFRNEFGRGPNTPTSSLATSEIVVLCMTGLGPYKRDARTSVTHIDEEGVTHTFTVGIPQLIQRPGRVRDVSVKCTGISSEWTNTPYLIQDVHKIARKNLKDKMPTIQLKAWSRALAASVASKKAKRDVSEDYPSILRLFSHIIDAATTSLTSTDIRCWRTLPQTVYLSRIPVNAGTYALTVDFQDADGNPISHPIEESIEIEKNEIKLLYFYEFR